MADNQSTPSGGSEFDFGLFPPDTCFHERRGPKPAPLPSGPSTPAETTQSRKERRRRVDPTTFEKQYSAEELEFMNAMQRYKLRSGKSFPSYGEVLDVARRLGYRRTGESSEIAGMEPPPDPS